jgi:hypothetical protein
MNLGNAAHNEFLSKMAMWLPMLNYRLLLRNFTIGSIGQNPQCSKRASEMLHVVRLLTEINSHKVWLKNIKNCPNYPRNVECQFKIIWLKVLCYKCYWTSTNTVLFKLLFKHANKVQCINHWNYHAKCKILSTEALTTDINITSKMLRYNIFYMVWYTW